MFVNWSHCVPTSLGELQGSECVVGTYWSMFLCCEASELPKTTCTQHVDTCTADFVNSRCVRHYFNDLLRHTPSISCPPKKLSSLTLHLRSGFIQRPLIPYGPPHVSPSVLLAVIVVEILQIVKLSHTLQPTLHDCTGIPLHMYAHYGINMHRV